MPSLTWNTTANNFYALIDKNKVYPERTNVPAVPVYFVTMPFTNNTEDANGITLKTLAQPLTNLFSTNRFILDCLDAPDGVFVSFKSADKPTLGFTGYW